MYGITNNMEQQHGTFEIRLYQNSRQLGISVRRIFNLPYTTHTRFLPHILEISKVTDQIYGHFLKMVKTMEQSNNMRVQYLTKLSKFSVKNPL